MSNFIIESKLYQGDSVYSGEGFAVEALIDGNSYGVVGNVSAEGDLLVSLPHDMPTDVLSERAPGMFGGTLELKPAISADKSGHLLYVVYVNQDMGPYKAGWTLANDEHLPISEEEAATVGT